MKRNLKKRSEPHDWVATLSVLLGLVRKQAPSPVAQAWQVPAVGRVRNV